MFSKHFIRMLLGLLITGAVGIVMLFLINEYDKAHTTSSRAVEAQQQTYSQVGRLPTR